MTVYVQAVDSHGKQTSEDWSMSGRAFDDFATGLSILLGSRTTLTQDVSAGWKLTSAVEDPAGYLPCYLCQNDKTDLPFGSDEAKIVLEHMRHIAFEQQDDARITEAFSNRELYGGMWNGVLDIQWFRRHRDALIQMLEYVAKTEGAKFVSF